MRGLPFSIDVDGLLVTLKHNATFEKKHEPGNIKPRYWWCQDILGSRKPGYIGSQGAWIDQERRVWIYQGQCTWIYRVSLSLDMASITKP